MVEVLPECGPPFVTRIASLRTRNRESECFSPLHTASGDRARDPVAGDDAQRIRGCRQRHCLHEGLQTRGCRVGKRQRQALHRPPACGCHRRAPYTGSRRSLPRDDFARRPSQRWQSPRQRRPTLPATGCKRSPCSVPLAQVTTFVVTCRRFRRSTDRQHARERAAGVRVNRARWCASAHCWSTRRASRRCTAHRSRRLPIRAENSRSAKHPCQMWGLSRTEHPE